jgi:hypothetical protein
MPQTNFDDMASFRDAVNGLKRGDFTRLDPLFAGSDDEPCRIRAWCDRGYFDREPEALNEALSCACFNGRTEVVGFLLDRGVDPAAGSATGLNAFHWAANRGQLETVRLLIERNAPLEIENAYGGTVLGCAVWSAVNETKPDHLAIVEALIQANANIAAANYPSGDERVDDLLQRYGSGAGAQSP